MLGSWLFRLDRWLTEVAVGGLAGLTVLLAVTVGGLVLALWIVWTSGRLDKPRGSRPAP